MRIEIVIRAGLRSDGESRLAAAVEQVANAVRSGQRPSEFEDVAFTVAVRDRADSLYALPDSINIYQVQVGPTPVLLTDFRSAHLVVTASIGMARVRALRNFVKEAKQQLPESGPGGVFIEIPGGVEAAADKLNEMLSHPAHQAVTWASIWTAGIPVRAVWRASENFNERLIEPAI